MDINNIITLKPEEEVLMIARQNHIPFIPRMVFFAVWILIPFFFMFPLFKLGGWGVMVFVLIILAALVSATRSWFAWGRTIFIVTDRRLIDVDQHGFFSRVISELFYSGIDDVTYTRKGIWQTIFGYGLVLIQTSGSADDIEVRRVKKPARLADLINDIREAVINEEPKDPKTRLLHKAARGLDEEEMEEVVEETKKRFRKRAFDNFYSDDEE